MIMMKVNSAAKASIIIKDIDDKPYIKLEALSEGTWGNYISLDLRYFEAYTTKVIDIAVKGDNFVELESTGDFDINDVICLKDINNKKALLIVKKIDGNKIYFDSPVKKDLDFGSKLSCSNIKLNIIASTRNKTENFYFYLRIKMTADISLK